MAIVNVEDNSMLRPQRGLREWFTTTPRPPPSGVTNSLMVMRSTVLALLNAFVFQILIVKLNIDYM